MKKTNLLSIVLSISLILSGCTNFKTETTGNPSNSPSKEPIIEVTTPEETTTEVTNSEEIKSPTTETEKETIPLTETQSEATTVENTYYTGFGFIDSFYTSENTNYLSVDEAEFFWSPEAIEEAMKDGKAFIQDDGTYIVYNGYYIRNNFDVLTNYKLAENCKFYLSTLIFDNYSKDNLSELEISKNLKEVSYDEFNNAISISQDARLRVWFQVENGYVTEVSHQFTP